jgi:hypothetical protein
MKALFEAVAYWRIKMERSTVASKMAVDKALIKLFGTWSCRLT